MEQQHESDLTKRLGQLGIEVDVSQQEPASYLHACKFARFMGGISRIPWEVRPSRSATLSSGSSEARHSSCHGSAQQPFAVYRITHALCKFPPMKRANLH